MTQNHMHKLQTEEKITQETFLNQYNLEVRYFQTIQRKLQSFYFSVWALGTLEAKVATSNEIRRVRSFVGHCGHVLEVSLWCLFGGLAFYDN